MAVFGVFAVTSANAESALKRQTAGGMSEYVLKELRKRVEKYKNEDTGFRFMQDLALKLCPEDTITIIGCSLGKDKTLENEMRRFFGGRVTITPMPEVDCTTSGSPRPR